MPDLADGLLYYVVFLFSTTLHEAAHAWAAARGGDLTAYQGGQVSLSPVPHIRREPIGMVVLPLFAVLTTGWPFGYASALYNPDWARRCPHRAAWMALAGPAVNLTLWRCWPASLSHRTRYASGTSPARPRRDSGPRPCTW